VAPSRDPEAEVVREGAVEVMMMMSRLEVEAVVAGRSWWTINQSGV